MSIKSKFSWVIVCIMLISLFFVSNQQVAAATTSTKSLKVNDTTLEFKEIIYIDGTSGNNTTGTGSKDKPFKTVAKGFDYLNVNCRDNGAIVMKDGTYDVLELFQGSASYNLNPKYNGLKISLLAETMGKVQFTNVGEWMVVENAAKYRVNIKFYGVIFKSLYKQWYHLGGDDWTNEYYNCVLPGNYGGWNGNVKNATIKVVNSLFVGAPYNYEYTTNPVSGSAINCASTTSKMDPKNGTKNNCLFNVTIDTNYNITSNGWQNTGIGTNPDGTVANIGVYGGQFSWGSKVIEYAPSPTEIKLVAETDYSQVLLNWDIIDNATSYIIKRSLKSDSNFEIISTNTNNSYIDTDVKSGVTYYYIVSAVVSGLESTTSNIAPATLKIKEIPDAKLKVVLEVKEELQLSVDDDLEENTKLIWTTSDSSVAIVNQNGVVTALAPGNTVITVKSADNTYTDYINVLVVNDARDYRLAVDLKIGGTCRLTIDDATDTVKVTWVSLDSNIATVSSKGKVTAVNKGLTIINATNEEGNVVGEIYIRVR